MTATTSPTLRDILKRHQSREAMADKDCVRYGHVDHLVSDLIAWAQRQCERQREACVNMSLNPVDWDGDLGQRIRATPIVPIDR